MAIVKVTNVRISFPQLFKPKAVSGDGDGEPRFSAAFVIVPGSANAKTLASAMETIAKEKWGAKGPAILAELKQKGRVAYKESPLSKDGEVYDGFEGMYSLNASNPQRVTVIDRDTTPLTSQDGRPYGGCYVDASIDLWVQDNAWGKRVNAKLRWVQFRGDGDAFTGGAPVTEDEFENIADGASAEDLV
jgi:hypothetical protein